MRRRYLIIVVCCFVMLSFAPVLFGESKNKDLYIEEFGTKAGKPIDKGFVFYDGRYIDAPYVVSQKGLGIFINDVMIEPPIEWPQPDLTQDTDPELPKGITQNSTFEDIQDHISKKYHYLSQHYSEDEVIRKKIEYYRTLPCVKEVKVIDMHLKEVEPDVIPEWGHIKLTLFSRNEPVLITLRSFPDRGVKFDKESVLQRLKDSKKYFERSLKNNDCYFFFSRGGRISSMTDAQELLRMTQILRSKSSIEDKFKALHRDGWKGLIDPDDSTTAKMVTNFSASPQLEKRLYKEIKSRKEKVYTPRDLQKNKENDSE